MSLNILDDAKLRLLLPTGDDDDSERCHHVNTHIDVIVTELTNHIPATRVTAGW